ncbi:MAG: translation elongation factor Ts [Syntrophorhabdales bacterium]|jgi:elongation factor Ts
MDITAELVKTLREKTGVGLMDCKEALKISNGDMDKAVDHLREKGLAKAQKRAGRAATEGTVAVYIHMGGKIATMVEINCETDFVAKTDQFQTFAKDVAMQVTAANPSYVKREDVPVEVRDKEKHIYRIQAKEADKPEKILDKIADGKLEKFYQEVCLLEQPFIKNPDISIKDLLEDLIAKMGENIVVRRFVRYQLGETVDA